MMPLTTRTTVRDSPGRKEFLLRLPHELFEQAKICADKNTISITQFINKAIRAYNEDCDPKQEEGPSSGRGWWID